jgi:hypothetical protein
LPGAPGFALRLFRLTIIWEKIIVSRNINPTMVKRSRISLMKSMACSPLIRCFPGIRVITE